MPSHVQSPRVVPFLVGEYEILIKKLEDPLLAIADRHVARTPCPSKDWPQRSRLQRILKFAWNDIRSTNKWAVICRLNWVIPSP